MPRKIKLYKKIDWLTVVLYTLLLTIGWINIYSADYNFTQENSIALSRADLQGLWIGGCSILILTIMLIDSKMFYSLAYVIYGIVLLLLIVTVFVSPNINGSHSWLVLGPLRIQPAEFAKCAVALAIARYMSNFDFNLKEPRCYLKLLGFILLPAVIIVLQSETGSALVFLALFLVIYREGLSDVFLLVGCCFVIFFIVVLHFSEVYIAPQLGSWGIFASLLSLIVIVWGFIFSQNKRFPFLFSLLGVFFGVFLIAFIINTWTSLKINYEYVALSCIFILIFYCFIISYIYHNKKIMIAGFFLVAMAAYCFSINYLFDNVLEQHQQTRIKVFMGMENDPSGTGYNVNQSKIAIGSGGFWGKGFLSGTQTKLNYVPEQVTDFIFCNIGEEFGFFGSTLVILLYLGFLLRLICLAERQFDPFNRIFGYCLISFLFFHLTINIGMVIGLLPVIGIPLPFISYGGSSLWAFTILLFIFIKLDAVQSEQLH